MAPRGAQPSWSTINRCGPFQKRSGPAALDRGFGGAGDEVGGGAGAPARRASRGVDRGNTWLTLHAASNGAVAGVWRAPTLHSCKRLRGLISVAPLIARERSSGSRARRRREEERHASFVAI